MPVVLMVVGFGWAVLGVANIAMAETAWAGLALMVNMALFILPGLVAGAVGWRMLDKRVFEAEPVEFNGAE